MEKHPICIKRTLDFSQELLGCPYKWCEKGTPEEKEPYYCSNNFKINISYLKEHGMNSSGFFNILRRYNKLKIPGMGKVDYYFPGSVDAWFFYLKKRKRLQRIIKNKKYPNGALFLANYKERGNSDHGHMAMMLDKKKNLIIHCYNDIHSETENNPGVIIEDFDKSNEWFGGDYYTHICYPKDWILIN
tara:strand:- start:324 stop:887 length:564 start_codon:yes stop_codon:yes gene_type:complete